MPLSGVASASNLFGGPGLALSDQHLRALRGPVLLSRRQHHNILSSRVHLGGRQRIRSTMPLCAGELTYPQSDLPVWQVLPTVHAILLLL